MTPILCFSLGLCQTEARFEALQKKQVHGGSAFTRKTDCNWNCFLFQLILLKNSLKEIQKNSIKLKETQGNSKWKNVQNLRTLIFRKVFTISQQYCEACHKSSFPGDKDLFSHTKTTYTIYRRHLTALKLVKMRSLERKRSRHALTDFSKLLIREEECFLSHIFRKNAAKVL